MNNKEINKAIAQEAGWKKIESFEEFWKVADRKKEKRFWAEDDLPDYCNDLNAMYGVEAMLTGTIHDNKQRTYYQHLREIIVKKMPDMLWDEESYINFQILHATALERAEAFLRTIGKWK